MSNRVMDEPWEIDPIEFVEGDWEIARAERPGMYIYRVYGVSTSEEVDAAQLIEWGMARVLQYEVLAPWEDSIHFPPDGRIMRRIYDKGTKANRCYVIADGDGFAYVNRYYLVLHGLAEGTDKFRRDVIAAKVAGASTDDTWEEDGICLVKKAGYTVTRSIIPGFYKGRSGCIGIRLQIAKTRLLHHYIRIQTEKRPARSVVVG